MGAEFARRVAVVASCLLALLESCGCALRWRAGDGTQGMVGTAMVTRRVTGYGTYVRWTGVGLVLDLAAGTGAAGWYEREELVPATAAPDQRTAAFAAVLARRGGAGPMTTTTNATARDPHDGFSRMALFGTWRDGDRAVYVDRTTVGVGVQSGAEDGGFGLGWTNFNGAVDVFDDDDLIVAAPDGYHRLASASAVRFRTGPVAGD